MPILRQKLAAFGQFVFARLLVREFLPLVLLLGVSVAVVILCIRKTSASSGGPMKFALAWGS